MAAKKRPVVKAEQAAAAPQLEQVAAEPQAGKAAVAPKEKKAAVAPKAVKSAVKTPKPAPVATPVPKPAKMEKAPKSEAGKTKDDKKKSGKKEKKMHEGDNAAAKGKMIRDSFTMPAADYALIGVLKARTLAAGAAVKKSELLRAGLVALAAMPAVQLIDLIAAMPEIKTGRPGKKKK